MTRTPPEGTTREQRRYLLTTTTPLALVIVVGFIWSAFLTRDVPDTIATHFSGRGAADSTSSPWSLITVVTASAVLTLTIFALFARGGATVGTAARFTTGLMAWTITLLMVLQVRVLLDQRGIGIPSEASLSGATLAWTIILPLVVAVLMGLLIRPVPRSALRSGDSVQVPELRVPDTATVVWFRNETMSPWIQALLYAVDGGSVLLCIASGTPLWSTLILVAVLGLAMLTSSSWRLRVDDHGFSYRSALGVPGKQLPYDDICYAEAVTVRPMEWGGWGWRFNGTGTGLITGSGPGIRITRTNRKVIEMTCGDAERGLAALKHYGVHVLDPAVVEEHIRK